MRLRSSRTLILLALVCATGCVTAEMRREGIPARKSVILGETLAIFPGILFHGIGHHYAGDHEVGSDLMGKEWKSLAYPIAWPFLAAASLTSPENASLAATLDEATGISMAAPIYFLGTWIYDILNTPAIIRAHNRMVDRMWEVKEAMDEAAFPRDIRLGSIRPGESLDRSLGVRDRLPPDVALAYELDPWAGPGELDAEIRPSPSGEVFLTMNIPPDAKAGTYQSTLRYRPTDVALTERTLPVQIRVLRPELHLGLLTEGISIQSTATGWFRGLAEFIYETPLPGTCVLEVKPLKESGGAEIHPAYDIRLSPRDDWDGQALEPNGKYRVEVAIYVSDDLPDGTYRGSLEIRAASIGQPPTTVSLPIELILDR